MDGQYTILSYAPVKKRRPCEYAFSRYVGQLVEDRHGIHKIAEIEEFYTIYEDGMVGTPHDMSPVDKAEFDEKIDNEIEYNEYLMTTCRTNRSIAEKNLKILRRIKDGRTEKN